MCVPCSYRGPGCPQTLNPKPAWQEAEAALAAAQDARQGELAEMRARLEQAAQAAAEDLDAAALDRSRLLGRRAQRLRKHSGVNTPQS